MKFYLAGPIHAKEDGGKKWRDWITPRLRNMGHDVLNPLDKYNGKELEENKKNLELFEKDKTAFQRKGKRIIKTDLAMVKDCDAVLAIYRPDLDTFGTVSEIFEASWHLKKPTYIICDGSKNLWMNSLATKIFKTLPEFLEFLDSM